MENKTLSINKNKEFRIGLLVALVIIIYLVFHLYSFLKKNELPIYEVQPGSIYTVSQTNGMILRKELLVTTEITGYINFYFSEGTRISKNSTVYSIDSDRNMYDKLAGNAAEIKLSGQDLQELKKVLQDNLVNVTTNQVSKARSEIMTGYQRMIDKTLLNQLMEIVKQTGISSNFNVIYSEASGVISYVYDEYTDYSLQDVSKYCFTKDYSAQSLYSTELITANSPVYKIITDDEWQIVVILDEELYGALAGKDTATFYLDNDIKVTAPITCFKKEDTTFAVLTLDKYMSNYSSKRFINVKFELEETTGLKIPETAITLKDYYRIPEKYLVAEKQSILVEEYRADTGVVGQKRYPIDIFYSENGFVYVDCNDFPKETYIYDEATGVRVMLYTFITKLEGAYNINKGYAVFKRIERLKTENGYVIVKRNSISGLSAYDHIALDASTVIEDAVIY